MQSGALAHRYTTRTSSPPYSIHSCLFLASFFVLSILCPHIYYFLPISLFLLFLLTNSVYVQRSSVSLLYVERVSVSQFFYPFFLDSRTSELHTSYCDESCRMVFAPFALASAPSALRLVS